MAAMRSASSRWLAAATSLMTAGIAFATPVPAETSAGSRKSTTRTAPVRIAPQPPPHDIAARHTEQLTVKARTPSTVASSATKSDLPIVDTAQSVTVITRNEMDIRGVLNLDQAVRYTAGITQDQRGGSVTRYDLFALRGFTVPVFLDGLKLQKSPIGFAIPQTDTSRIERIEILKGPASALYGQSAPGGLVALSSHLPTDQRQYGSITGTGGSFDLYRIDGDVGGYANHDGTVRFRLYGTANGQHSQLAKTSLQRFSISPAVTIGGNGDDTLTLLGNYQYDPKNASYGSAPLEGSLRPAKFGYLPRNFYDGDLNYEGFKRYQGALTYIATHRFSPEWSLTSRGRYDNVRTTYQSVYTTGLYTNPQQTEVGRGAIYSRERLQNLAFDTQLHGKIRTRWLTQELITGFDYQQSTAPETVGYASAPDLNVLHPNYYMPVPAPYYVGKFLTKQKQFGAYGQDIVEIDRHLFLTGSLRNDWYRATRWNNDTPSHQRASQITWRASGLYHFDFGLAPYIAYSTSFEPQAGLVQTGTTVRQADPSLGKQLEGGAKYQIPGTPILLTAAGFHIEQTNVLVSIPNSIYSTQSGRVHSDGFEFEAHVDAYKGLMVTAAYSTQRVRDDSTGKPLIQSGRGNASLFAFYTLPDTVARGLGFGLGLRHAASAYGGPASYGDIKVPSYTVFDGSLRYGFGKATPALRGWTLSASVRNLFDKRYVANCYGYAGYNEWCWMGERRNAQASLGLVW